MESIRSWGKSQMTMLPPITFFNLSKFYNLDELTDDNIVDSTLHVLRDHFDINSHNYDIKVCPKENIQGFSMHLHMDDWNVIRLSKKSCTDHRHILINDRISLFNNKPKKPIWSVIIYLSTRNHDFNGGNLQFVDGTSLAVDKYDIVVFDSRILHEVTKITSGVRKSILIKFYPPDHI